MPKPFLTLYDLCLQSIARLIKNSYWDPELPLLLNPFAFLPSTIIDKLIVNVTRISGSRPLLSSDLRLLITSDRVQEFLLEDDEDGEAIDLNEENFRKILIELSSSCRHLIAVKFNLWWYEDNLPRVSHALNYLLSVALKLKRVESRIKFDLYVLHNSVHLEKLVLHFPVKNHIYDFLGTKSYFRQHKSLKYFEVFEDEECQVSPLDIAIILKYCTELNYINCDISKSLEHLHAEEFHNGSLTHKYKIQKCHLGTDDDYPSEENIAATDGVRIALLTCPDLQDVKIFTNDRNIIADLSKCQNLNALSIKLNRMPYSFGVQSLLEKSKIGYKLKSLELKNFSNVDFSSVGKCCPNLEKLIVYYGEECGCAEYLPNSFRKLHSLALNSIDFSDCKIDTLFKILRNAANMESLTVVAAGQLTDKVFTDLLKKNNLRKLKNLCICGCALTLHGMQNLATSLTALENLDVSAINFDFEEIVPVVKRIKPHIVMKLALF